MTVPDGIDLLVVEDAEQNGMGRVLAGLAVLAILLLPLGLVAAPRSETVAVIAPPGEDAAHVVAQAGGAILRRGGWDNILVARAGDPDFVARLYASGAWLVVDARFAGGCGPTPLPHSQNL